MKKGFKYTAILLIWTQMLFSADVTEIFDTPTAMNPEQATYQFAFTAYGDGGLSLRAAIGLNDFLQFGLVQYIDGLIGNGKNKWAIPGAFAKVKFTPLPAERFNVAFGYDGFYSGSLPGTTEKVYGLYTVFSKGFMWFAPDANLFSFGLRFPLLPDTGRPQGFTSIVLRFGQYFDYSTELSDVTFDHRARFDFINNHKASIFFSESFSVDFILQVGGKIRGNNTEGRKLSTETGRNIKLSYKNFF